MEMCDVVDEQGAATGRCVARGTPLRPGDYYLVVHVWIQDESGAYLVQQRAFDRPTDPGVWATTAGQVQAGEDGLAAALREVSEELGLDLTPAHFRRLMRHAMEDRVEDIWLATVTRAVLGPPRPGPEVADWKWASKAMLIDLARRGEFFGYSYLDKLPH